MPVPEIPGRRERRRVQTLDHVATTAMQLFEAQGYDATTMEQIALRADVAKGTLYNHFATKEAVLAHWIHLELAADTARLAELVGAISDRFEASVGQAWRFDPARAEHGPELRAIVGFRFQVEHVQLKLKLSQNHPDANQQAVIAALEALASPSSHELAQWMRWHREQSASSG